MNPIAIIGAGGHTRTVINILELNKIPIQAIFEDNLRSPDEKVLGYSVKSLQLLDNNNQVVISK